MRKVLIVSVHPDDETLGCGGTILKHKVLGDELHWLIFTKATESLGYNADFLKQREQQIDQVSKIYGFQSVHELGFQTTQLHKIDFNVLLQSVNKVIDGLKPELIYMINRSDAHTDHRIAAQIMMSCTKSFRKPYINKILMYECLSETEMAPALPENIFLPNVFSDITNYLEQKKEIMRLYTSEIAAPPFPRSLENVEALARLRGSECGVLYGEAFMLVRERF
ncbi:MAG: PIG-L deacetylase family protein [Sporolactobacillus sp.]